MNEFIAYGGGRGSTAILLKKLKSIRSGDLEVVFVDHGADLPETQKYVRDIQEELDINITTRQSGNLYDYCWQHRVLPSIHWRWCTDKFKIRPMKKYVGTDIPIIGLTYDERWRAKDFEIKGKGIYPLIREEITTRQTLGLFEEISIPCKSGCFFCPFQNKESWRRLFFNHPTLFKKALALEERVRERNNRIWLYEGLLKNLNLEFQEQITFAQIEKTLNEQGA